MTWFLQRLNLIHRSVCFSDSIPWVLMGVDTRKDSSARIIKPDINVFGKHLNIYY